MKKIIAGILLFLVTLQLFAATDSPVGTWEVFTKGNDKGLYRFTFSGAPNEAGNFNAYGLASDSSELEIFSGVWIFSEDNKFVLITLPADGDDGGATLRAKINANKKITGLVMSEDGNFPFNGKPAAAVYNMAGNWNATIKESGETMNSILTFSATERAAVFNLTDNEGTVGKFILAANGQFIGFGGSGPDDSSPVSGRVNTKKNTLSGTIFNEDSNGNLKAVKQ